jgi:hypothetical protein
MTVPIELRKQLLEKAAPIIDEYINAGLSDTGFKGISGEARSELWDTIKQIILGASDPTPLSKLTDGDISQRVDAVLSEVACGDITPAEGKKLIGLLQAGFDVAELPKLIERLNEIEKA